MQIRQASFQDLPDITEIYNEAIATTVATFDTEPKSLENRKQWLLAHDEHQPVLVAEMDNRVVGWASLSRWSERKAYDQTLELSVYILSSYREKGIGRKLMESLLEMTPDLDVHVILSRIAGGNEASLHLHEALDLKKSES
jgi:L-amino acid N-acyltransferase YncA